MDVDEIEAIKQLKARYFRFLDTRQWDQYCAVFTDDLQIRVESERAENGSDGEPVELPQGNAAFVAHLQGLLAGVTTVHHGHMPEITLIGPDTASGIWAMEDILQWPDGAVVKGYGHYHETYRKVDGEWRIASLNLTRLRMDYRQPSPVTG